MKLGLLFLQSVSTGIITQGELNWISNNLSSFSRTEISKVIQLGRLLDKNQVNIGCRLIKALP